jgi:hypothetical protein
MLMLQIQRKQVFTNLAKFSHVTRAAETEAATSSSKGTNGTGGSEKEETYEVINKLNF